jgi:hypothetical protein
LSSLGLRPQLAGLFAAILVGGCSLLLLLAIY